MVKNLPTVERSTKIRFGKNCTNDQAENTVVFNASNVELDVNTPGSVYMTPVRIDPDMASDNIMVLAYNRDTKELTDSNAIAREILNFNLLGATKNGNVTPYTVEFKSTDAIPAAATSIVTTGNVGISNLSPTDTLSVGSKFHVNVDSSNVLTVLGNTYIQNSLVVDGDATFNGLVTTLHSNNTVIKDAILELGKDNVVGDSLLDLGLIMTRPNPDANVAIGFREVSNEFVIAYTNSNADGHTITPVGKDMNVHVYGQIFTESNVGIINTSPTHTLDVGSNLFVDEFGSNILVVTGNTSISADLTVDGDTLFVDSGTDRVGVNTLVPDAELHVVGNVYVSSNLTVDTDTLHVDVVSNRVGINQINPTKDLDVNGTIAATRRVDNSGYDRLLIGTDTGATIHPSSNAHLISVGYRAGYDRQQSNSVAIGYKSGSVTQAESAVAIGERSGETGQGASSIAIGDKAAYENQAAFSIAIGENAGGQNQAGNSIAIGKDAGSQNQGQKSIAIGDGAGKFNQGEGAIAIGYFAGYPTSQAVGSVIINGGTDAAGFNNTTTQNALFVNPVRNVNNSNLLMYNADSKEFTYGTTLNNTLNVLNNLTVDTDTLFVDSVSKEIGINTALPDANLHVVGNTYISSNLTVDLNTLHVDVNKHFVGIETNYPDATLHLMGNAYISEDLTVDTDTLHVDSTTNSVGIETKTPDANLHVVGNVYVSSNLTVDTNTLHVDTEANHIGINNVNPDAELHVVGNAYISSNLTVDTNTLHVDTEANHIGINTINPDAEFHVVGNAYVSSNLTVDTDTFHVDVEADRIGVNTKTPDAGIHLVGNAYVSSNVIIADTTATSSKTTGALIVAGGLGVAGDIHATHANLEDVEADSVNITDTTTSTSVTTGALRVAGGISTQENLNVNGNVHVSSNLKIGTANFFVNTATSNVGIGTLIPGELLDIAAASGDNDAFIRLRSGSGGSPVTESGIKLTEASSYGWRIAHHASSDDLKFVHQDQNDAINGDNYMVFKSGGNIGVATDAPDSKFHVNGNVYVGSTVDSATTTTGALIIAGGMGIAKKIVGQHANFEDVVVDSLTVEDTTLSTSKTTGAVIVAGGLGVTDNVYASRFVGDGGLLSNIATNLQSITENGNTTSNVVQFTGTETSFVSHSNVGIANTQPDHTLSVGTNFYVNEDGANTVVVDGNVSVSSNLTVGSNISITGLTTNKFPIVGANKFLEDSIITKTGSDIVISGGLQVTGNIFKNGDIIAIHSNNTVIKDRILTLSNNNTQTALDVGIIMEYPGHNIAIAHHGDESPERLSIGYTQNGYVDTTIAADSNNITLDVLGNLQVQNNFTVDTSTFHVNSVTNRVGVLTTAPAYTLDIHGNSNAAVARSKSSVVTDATAATNKTSGAVTVVGGIGVGGDIHASDVNFENATLDSAIIQNTTAATNKTSGALQVTGGVGIQGDIHATHANLEDVTADSVTVEDSTVASSKTTGALKVAGGVGVSGDIHATHVNFEDAEVDSLTVTDTTASSSTTTGAAKIAGGLGVAGSVYAAQYYGDGSTLTGLVTTFGAVVANGNTTSNTVQFTNANTGIITSGKIGVKTANPTYDLQVTGNSYISSNVTVDTNTFHVDAVNNKVGVGTTEPDKTLHVQGDIKFTGTLFEDDAPFVTSPWVTTGTDIYYNIGNVGFGTNANVDANVHVNGNIYATSNVTAGFDTDTASCFGRAAVGFAGETNHATFAHVGNNTSTNYALKQTATGVTHLNTKANQHIRLSVNNNEKMRVTGGGDLKVGSNILYVDASEASVGLGTATPNSNLHVVGNAYVSSNLTVGNNVYVTGGLITNTGGVTKKTYSVSRTVTTGVTPLVDINFTSNIFYAKITAQLIDGDEDLSTMILEVSGGRKSGETPTKNIAVGTKNIFGDQTNTNPWSPTVTTTGNKITLTTSNALDAQDGYDVFVEYMSSNSDGSVVSVVERVGGTSTTLATFGY